MDQANQMVKESFFATWRAPVGSLAFFFFLLILPLTTAWLTCSTIQENLEKDQQQQSLDEMAEMTAHLARLANPETYFQESLRRLSDSFRWASETADISRISTPEALELYLFNQNGTRLAWPAGESGKKKVSEDYLRILISMRKNPGLLLNKREQTIAGTFSGNSITANSLVRNPETLTNFQGIGLRRFGAWFETRLPGGAEGHLIAWMHPDKIDRYQLAEQAIKKIQRLAGNSYIFAWIDLNNTARNNCTGINRFQEVGLRLLSAEGLKSGFKIADELFAINDTPEGIRLVCGRQAPTPPRVLQDFYNFLRSIVPVLILFMVWKTAFMVRFDLSAGLQFLMIFGFTALTGIVILMAGSMAYQYEKQNSLVADCKQRAVEILEKIDSNFSSSYGDLLHQYRHLNTLLSVPGSDPAKILAPLTVAQNEDNLAFAGYTDRSGSFIFKAPETRTGDTSDTIESKYANLIGGISSQIIRTFNSSRMPGNVYSADPIGMRSLSSKPVEGLLANRSTLQNITFDGDETLTFMDLAIDENDTASGCLFIVHEPRKMQIKYMETTGQNVARSTGFGLAAFPKRHAAKSAYFPRFSYTAEPPLWKLHDLVNQTQVSSFKQGRIDGKEVLVAAIAGHNLKNYNLFLIMPFDPIRIEAGRLSNIFIAATILSLLFIAVLSIMLVRSLINPVAMLAANAMALQNPQGEAVETLVFSEANELESISTGLTDLILKVREFNEGRSVKRHLLPPEPLMVYGITLDGFQITKCRDEKEIYHFSSLDSSLTLAFMMRTDLTGIEASLTLSMARMAVRLISEDLNVHSAFHCLKDLEAYFRINLRRKLGGDFIALLINHDENKLYYSGFGAIKLAVINSCNQSMEMLALPLCEAGSQEFQSFGNQEVEFGAGMIAMAISPAFSDQCLTKLPGMVPTLSRKNLAGEPLRGTLQAEVEKVCADNYFESASLLVVQNSGTRKDVS